MRAREKTIDFLKWMVEQYSPSHHEHAFSRSLTEHLERRGWLAHTDEVGNTIASMGEGDTCIALLGHIDTVPGEVPVRIENSSRSTVHVARDALRLVQDLFRIRSWAHHGAYDLTADDLDLAEA